MFDTLLPIFIYSYVQFLKHFINSLLTTFITAASLCECRHTHTHTNSQFEVTALPGYLGLNNYGKYELTQITRYLLWIFTFQCKQQILHSSTIPWNFMLFTTGFACVRVIRNFTTFSMCDQTLCVVLCCAHFISFSPFSFFECRTCKAQLHACD